jgi:hypothetical protein
MTTLSTVVALATSDDDGKRYPFLPARIEATLEGLCRYIDVFSDMQSTIHADYLRRLWPNRWLTTAVEKRLLRQANDKRPRTCERCWRSCTRRKRKSPGCCPSNTCSLQGAQSTSCTECATATIPSSCRQQNVILPTFSYWLTVHLQTLSQQRLFWYCHACAIDTDWRHTKD